MSTSIKLETACIIPMKEFHKCHQSKTAIQYLLSGVKKLCGWIPKAVKSINAESVDGHRILEQRSIWELTFSW